MSQAFEGERERSPRMRRPCGRTRLLPILAIPLLLPALVAALPAAGAREAARAVPPGGALWLDGISDVVTGERLDLELTRFEVLAPEARVVVHDDGGARNLPPPVTLFFRGRIAGEPGSRAVLALHETGDFRGLALASGELRLLGHGSPEAAATGRLEARRVEAIELATRRPFRCELEGLGAAGIELPGSATHLPAGEALVPEAPGYTAVYAVEADYEFYQLFDDATAATDYIVDLVAFLSMLYDDEIGTTIRLGTVHLRTTASDPWTQTSSLCALYEFGRYWNNNYGAVSRTAALMLSGKGSGGGVAWLSVLCDGAFSYNRGTCTGLNPAVDLYGGAYAFVGSMNGGFDLWDPRVVWDILATAHEVGHNFSSPHTHCYAGLEGNANQIDFCYTSQCSGSNCSADTCLGSGSSAHWQTTNCACPMGTSRLPGVGSTSGGTGGQGVGTIMSYCHLLSPGYSNVSLNFGTGHTYGIAAGRVASKMSSYVVATAAAPGCLDYVAGGAVFVDGFETGNTNRWGGDQP